MIELYITELRESREELMQSFALSSRVKSEHEGRWSARQIMRHLYLSEFSSAKIFRSAERVCERRDSLSDAALEGERSILTDSFLDRSIRVEAPERIQPIDLHEDDDVDGELVRSREFLLQQVYTLTDEQMRCLMFRHPLRGDLSLYGWLWFIACHERRHCAQMRELP